MLIELSEDEINCMIKALDTVIDEHEGCENLQGEHSLSDKLSKINKSLKKNSINLLVQKLLVSDWYKIDSELFTQLIKEASRYAKEIIDVANNETIKKQDKEIQNV